MPQPKKKYDLIASIGDTCATSIYLRRNKLQYASYPLDWIGHDPFSGKIEFLTNHFTNFMNIEDIVPMEKPESDEDVNCDAYRNTRTGTLIWHDFPTGVPFEKSFPEVKNKYDRRISRLYKRIEKSKNILFVWFSPRIHLKDEEIIAGQQKLAQYFAPRHINLLIIEDDKTATQITETHLSDTVTKITYNMFSPIPEAPVSTVLGNLASGTQIFQQYQLNTPWWFMPMLKIVRCIPHKALKKNLKRKLYNY